MSAITPMQEQAVVEGVPKGLFIGGEWREATGGRTLPVEDPSTTQTLCEVADATVEDAGAALDAAVAAQADWAAHPPRERGEILRRSYEAVVARSDELALLMTLEMGKPLSESRAEVLYAADFLRWFSEEAVRVEGRFATAPNGAGRLLTMRQPVGPCLLITPWNFPLAMGTRKIGPAIAAGCTMVVKPAKQTPLSMLVLAQILDRGGAAGWRAQRLHLLLIGSDDRAIDRRPAPAQALLHRLDRGRPHADRRGRRQRAARLDGARRQRPVRRLRGRRPRRGRRGRDAREDAQHRRGLHGRQPLPRRTRRSPSSSPSELAERMGALSLGRGVRGGRRASAR